MTTAGKVWVRVRRDREPDQRDGGERERVEDADEQQLRQPEPVDVGAVRERAAGELQIRQSGQAGHQVL